MSQKPGQTRLGDVAYRDPEFFPFGSVGPIMGAGGWDSVLSGGESMITVRRT